jgi:hypothetical protein
MNDETRFAAKVRALLDGGLKDLDPAISTRLKQVRERALARHRATGSVMDLAGAAQARGMELPGPSPWRLWRSAGVVALALAVAVVLWSQREGTLDPSELDAALLSGDLPVRAYLHPQFPAWLQHSER